jgi:dihydrofolate reductase
MTENKRIVERYIDGFRKEKTLASAVGIEITANSSTQKTMSKAMSKVRFSISMSLDGYIAGPDQSAENPLGVGGEQLHQWATSLAAFRKAHGDEGGGEVNPSSAIVEEMFQNVGAVIMGRHMFGGGSGAWNTQWQGWWGDNPPFHMPVFVLTHHSREPLAMKGGTTFHFITDGIQSALEQARQVAAGKDVLIGGGARALQQYLAAGLVDELNVSLVPIFLGGGDRLFDNVGGPDQLLEQMRVVDAGRSAPALSGGEELGVGVRICIRASERLR